MTKEREFSNSKCTAYWEEDITNTGKVYVVHIREGYSPSLFREIIKEAGDIPLLLTPPVEDDTANRIARAWGDLITTHAGINLYLVRT